MNKTYQKNNLHKTIMRRVYYAYTLSIVLSKDALLGFLFGASVIGFWKLVSVTSIINNFLSVKVGELPGFLFNALTQAHTLALLAFGIIVFTGLSLGIKFTFPRYQHATNQSFQSV